MIKKILGILIVGLLIATIVPVGSSIAEKIDEKDITRLSSSQIEIKIRGGHSIHAFVKNIGTTDLNDVDMKIVLDGRFISRLNKNAEATTSIEAGKTVLHLIPVFGFGAMNIEITVDTTTATASAMVLGNFVFVVN